MYKTTHFQGKTMNFTKKRKNSGKILHSVFVNKRENTTFAIPKRWCYRLAVRTPGFHPGSRGSIPRSTTKKRTISRTADSPFLFHVGIHPNKQYRNTKEDVDQKTNIDKHEPLTTVIPNHLACSQIFCHHSSQHKNVIRKSVQVFDQYFVYRIYFM